MYKVNSITCLNNFDVILKVLSAAQTLVIVKVGNFLEKTIHLLGFSEPLSKYKIFLQCKVFLMIQVD